VVAFSAPPVLQLSELLSLLHERAWDTYVILSPTASTWVDVDQLEVASGHAVRVEPRRPANSDSLPAADAIIAAPMTFNSLNKWAAGISDTFALGLLNEAIGLDLPINAALCIKEALRRHPVYDVSISRLVDAGVNVLRPEEVLNRTSTGLPALDWPAVLPS
jgi:phosphopantothenoylcysteine decarboxylase